jgi:hypothetical protein
MKKDTNVKHKYYQIAGRQKPDSYLHLFKKHYIDYQEARSAARFIKSRYKEAKLELWKVETKITTYRI